MQTLDVKNQNIRAQSSNRGFPMIPIAVNKVHSLAACVVWIALFLSLGTESRTSSRTFQSLSIRVSNLDPSGAHLPSTAPVVCMQFCPFPYPITSQSLDPVVLGAPISLRLLYTHDDP
jgi:hypothetical protein